MATVYLARRLAESSEIPRVVALKKLAPQFAKQPEFVAMFLDEAHLATRIRHPNVVSTYEFLRTGEGLGIVMDLVVGESLVQLVRGPDAISGRAPLGVVAAIVIDGLEGLHAAHEATDDTGRSLGLVHRDVSPHNLLVGADGVAKVIDFGVAKAAGRLQTTEVGVLKGKFAYMAPEQIQGKEVDRRTDVYAAGIVLWEALTARKLFLGSTNEELLEQRSAGTLEIPPPRGLNPAVSPALEAVTLRALRPAPGDRYESARAMALAIREVVDVASPEEVAGWVLARAGEKLTRLDARRRELEDLPAHAGDGAAAPRQDAPPPPPARVAPHGVAIDIPEAASPAGRESHSPSPSGLPGAVRTRARFADDLVLSSPPDGHGASAPLELDASPRHELQVERPHPAPREVSRPPSPTREREAPRRLLRGTFTLLILVAVVALGAGSFLRGPALLKARIVAASREEGVDLAFDHVEVQRSGLRLFGVKASLAGCPSLGLVAAEVDLGIDRGGVVDGVTLSGFELQLSDTASAIGSQLRAWRRTHRLLSVVDGRSGHVVWSIPGLPAVRADGQDATLHVSPAADVSLASASVLVTLPRGHVGPWSGHVDLSASESRVAVGLDLVSPDAPPRLVFVDRPQEGVTWTVTIPRESTFRAGIPPEALGLTTDVAIELELQVRVPPEGRPVRAELHLALSGVATDPRRARSAVDVTVNGRVAGDPAAPLRFSDWKVGVGGVESVVGGTVTLEPDHLKVDFERSSSDGVALPFLSFDTRAWTQVPAASARARAPKGTPR
jgi:serine/threonine-protein kinase